MESQSYTVALLILAVAGLSNCATVKQELRKLNNRIQNNRQNIINMQQNIIHLGYENRQIRKELDKANNRTNELEIRLESALSSSLATTDNGFIVQLENENRELRTELDKANNRTSELEIKLESALSSSLAIIDNGSKDLTVRDKLEKIKDVNNLLATDIGHLHNTTSEHEETILEMTTKLDKIITTMANCPRPWAWTM